MEADESGTHIMSLNDDISYGDPVASSTGIIYLHSVPVFQQFVSVVLLYSIFTRDSIYAIARICHCAAILCHQVSLIATCLLLYNKGSFVDIYGY